MTLPNRKQARSPDSSAVTSVHIISDDVLCLTAARGHGNFLFAYGAEGSQYPEIWGEDGDVEYIWRLLCSSFLVTTLVLLRINYNYNIRPQAELRKSLQVEIQARVIHAASKRLQNSSSHLAFQAACAVSYSALRSAVRVAGLPFPTCQLKGHLTKRLESKSDLTAAVDAECGVRKIIPYGSK